MPYEIRMSDLSSDVCSSDLPAALSVALTKGQELRYGENPHQHAALYLTGDTRGIAQAEQVQGKALSYNNLGDADAALELVAEFRDAAPSVVIVKHANPCGVANARSEEPTSELQSLMRISYAVFCLKKKKK